MITLDLPIAQQTIIEQASAMQGLQVNDFIEQNIFQKAVDVLKAENNWQVTPAEMKLILQELESPASANPELKSLLAMGEALDKA